MVSPSSDRPNRTCADLNSQQGVDWFLQAQKHAYGPVFHVQAGGQAPIGERAAEGEAEETIVDALELMHSWTNPSTPAPLRFSPGKSCDVVPYPVLPTHAVQTSRPVLSCPRCRTGSSTALAADHAKPSDQENTIHRSQRDATSAMTPSDPCLLPAASSSVSSGMKKTLPPPCLCVLTLLTTLIWSASPMMRM